MKGIIEKLLVMRNTLDDIIKQLGTENISHPKPKGRPKVVIFHEKVDESRLANCIKHLHHRHFNQISKVMEVNGEYYGETDFMLCLYFALVKLQLAPSIKFRQINKQYYSFLTHRCNIRLTEKERTYNNHLNKVVRTGVDLHLLTEEILIRKHSEGVMKLEDLPIWQRMLVDAERLLMKDEYINTLAKK